jgi:hypothetical protein
MRITINYMVDINDEYFEVRFTANCYMMNDAVDSYDSGSNYVEMEEVEWDEFLYTLEENNAIRKVTQTLDFYKEFEAEYLDAIKP